MPQPIQRLKNPILVRWTYQLSTFLARHLNFFVLLWQCVSAKPGKWNFRNVTSPQANTSTCTSTLCFKTWGVRRASVVLLGWNVRNAMFHIMAVSNFAVGSYMYAYVFRMLIVHDINITWATWRLNPKMPASPRYDGQVRKAESEI